jgi:hypothetical protein
LVYPELYSVIASAFSTTDKLEKVAAVLPWNWQHGLQFGPSKNNCQGQWTKTKPIQCQNLLTPQLLELSDFCGPHQHKEKCCIFLEDWTALHKLEQNPH